LIYATDFGGKDDEHLVYVRFLENIYENPRLLKPHNSEVVQKLAEQALKNFKVWKFFK